MHIVPQMKQARLKDEVKLRIPQEMKRDLVRLASVQMVSISDVVRRAVTNHIRTSKEAAK